MKKIKELTETLALDPDTPAIVDVYEHDRTHTFLEERTDKTPTHTYVLRERDPEAVENPNQMRPALAITFHEGHHPARGLNGWTTAALLDVLIDRMRTHQRGPFSCRENALVITKLEEAHGWVMRRRGARKLAGKSGTQKV